MGFHPHQRKRAPGASAPRDQSDRENRNEHPRHRLACRCWRSIPVAIKANFVSTNWLNVDGIISARLTNVVTFVPFSQASAAQFFRVAQLP